ncbi:MAG: hypothetical protein Q4F05_08325 [bacterium]|nr:hypothetical protein [bacterium]
MSKDLMMWLPWASIFLFIFLLIVLLHRRFVENNVWGKIVKKYKDNVDLKVLSESEFVTRFGAIETNSILYKLDRLMLTSGIKSILPFVNGEVFLAMMMVCSMAGFFEGIVFFHNGFVALFLAALQTVVLYVIAIGLAGKTYNQIEDNTAIFISILSNHAKGSSDIVSIMQNTIPSLSGPLRGIAEKFVLDAENTGNVDVAFDYMKESVDNRQLQTIIVNLKNCMHYQANYEEVLAQMMSQVAAGLSAREDRKNILFSMKLTLIVISIMAVIIVWIIGAGLAIDVKGSLTGNVFGQLLLLITGFLYLMFGIKMFKTDK